MHQLIHKGTLAASALALATGIVACEPNVNEDNLRHEVSTLGGNTWYMSDTRLGGGVILTATSDPNGSGIGGPEGFGSGSLALTTNGQNTAKAQVLTAQFSGTLLGDIERLSYQTFQHPTHLAEGGFEDGVPSFQVTADVNGDAAGGFTTLVYEPYNTSGNDVQNNVWQEWQPTDAGQNVASSRTIAVDCTTAVNGNPAGPPFESYADIAARCPAAEVIEIGVNIGSFNPNYVTAVDDLEVAIADNDDEGTDPQTSTFDFGPKGSGSQSA
jgi:hypothetical protein